MYNNITLTLFAIIALTVIIVYAVKSYLRIRSIDKD